LIKIYTILHYSVPLLKVVVGGSILVFFSPLPMEFWLVHALCVENVPGIFIYHKPPGEYA
jgi:hypothetical protein